MADEKHFLVEGAQFECDYGRRMDKLVVLTQAKDYINDSNGSKKLIASTKDIGTPFEANFFGPCGKKGGNPCTLRITGWKEFKENVTLSNGGKILTEDSKAICAIAGSPCVKVTFHGQTAEVASQHFNAIETETLKALNPLANTKPPSVQSIKLTLTERQQNNKFDSEKNTAQHIIKVNVRVDEKMEFEVVKSKGDKNKINWKVIKAHSFEGETTEFLNVGPIFNTNFDELGQFRVVAFGNIDPKKQNDIHCCIDIEAIKNTVKDITINNSPTAKATEILFIRKGIPVTFSAKYEIEPATAEESIGISMQVVGSEEKILATSEKDFILFTPPNSAADYKVTLTKLSATAEEQKITITKKVKTQTNGVIAVTSAPPEHIVRPGTDMTFTVTKLDYGTLADAQPFEVDAIHWKLNGKPLPQTGGTLSLDGYELMTPGKYSVDAFADGESKGGLHKTDDWNFEVKNNEVTKLDCPTTQWIVGKTYTIKAETIFPFQEDTDKITWNFTEATADDFSGANPLGNSLPGTSSWDNPLGSIFPDILDVPPLMEGLLGNTYSVKAMKKGEFVVTAEMNGSKKELKVSTANVQIKKWCFTYFNKDIHKESSIGLKTYMYVMLEGLTNEEVELYIWEHKVQYNIGTDTYKMVLIDNKKVKLNNGELFVEIPAGSDKQCTAGGEIWEKLHYDERKKCQIFFTLKKSGALEDIQFEKGKVKEYKQGDDLYGHIFPVTNKKDIGIYLIMTPNEKIVDAYFVNDKYEKLYKVIQYDDIAKGFVKTTGFKPGTKIKVALVENLKNDKEHPTDPIANSAGEIPVSEDGSLRIKFHTDKKSIGEHTKYIKGLPPFTPRTFYMSLHHKDSQLLFPVDVNDNDITNKVAEYFDLAKTFGKTIKQNDVNKFATTAMLAYVKRNYFLQLKIAEKVDQNEALRELAPVVLGEELEKVESKTNGCPRCNANVTVEQLKEIFTKADDTTLKKAAEAYTKYMKDLGMNTCWNKAHFFAQAFVESGLSLHVKNGENFNWYYESLPKTFKAFQTEEGKEKAKLWGRPVLKPSQPGVSEENQKNIANWAYSPDCAKGKELGNRQPEDGWNFRGKGLIQLTGRSAYDYANTYTKKEGADIITNPDLVLSDISIAVLSSMAFCKWKKINIIANGNSQTRAISIRVGKEVGSSYTEKQNAFEKTTSEVFKINDCLWGKVQFNAKDVVTYHIYSDGRIEKHIPKEIKDEFKNKYKYIYHDDKEGVHDICTIDAHETREKGVGEVNTSKPSHAKEISDDEVSENSTTRRVIYENGDIAEYGTHPSKGKIWLLYRASANTVELVKMPDSINYEKDGAEISYTFTSTYRKYTGAGSFAGFIGALAETKLSLTTSGSCFREGSSFPSQEHCNGRSVDTLYLTTIKDDQAFINAMIKFHFTEMFVGNNDYCKKLNNAGNGGALHNSHLHSGNFDNNTVKIVKEK